MMTKLILQIHILVYAVQANIFDICYNADSAVDIAARQWTDYGMDSTTVYSHDRNNPNFLMYLMWTDSHS